MYLYWIQGEYYMNWMCALFTRVLLPCFISRITKQITLEWVHQQFTIPSYTLFYFLHHKMNQWMMIKRRSSHIDSLSHTLCSSSTNGVTIDGTMRPRKCDVDIWKVISVSWDIDHIRGHTHGRIRRRCNWQWWGEVWLQLWPENQSVFTVAISIPVTLALCFMLYEFHLPWANMAILRSITSSGAFCFIEYYLKGDINYIKKASAARIDASWETKAITKW